MAPANRGNKTATRKPDTVSTPPKVTQPPMEPRTDKKSKKQRASLLNSLLDGLPDSKAAGTNEQKSKASKTSIRLATHMSGEKKGKLSGKAFFTIMCAYAENEAMVKLVKAKMHQVWQPTSHACVCYTCCLFDKVHTT